MACSSYLCVPDPNDPSRNLVLQFKYGFLREISYKLGDEICWEHGELPPTIEIEEDALVPAWEMTDRGRQFALSVIANRISGITEVSASEADELFAKHISGDNRHAWAI
jgi:hypothetical protein